MLVGPMLCRFTAFTGVRAGTCLSEADKSLRAETVCMSFCMRDIACSSCEEFVAPRDVKAEVFDSD